MCARVKYVYQSEAHLLIMELELLCAPPKPRYNAYFSCLQRQTKTEQIERKLESSRLPNTRLLVSLLFNPRKPLILLEVPPQNLGFRPPATFILPCKFYVTAHYSIHMMSWSSCDSFNHCPQTGASKSLVVHLRKKQNMSRLYTTGPGGGYIC